MTNRPYRLADLMRAGETVLTAWSSAPDTGLVRMIAHSPIGSVTLDMQHGGHNEQSVWDGLAAIIAQDKPAIVRIPVGRFDFASRALDFGADAVIAPMINTVGDAEAFAAAMKYPPLGERSWGVSRVTSLRGIAGGEAYLKTANAKTLSLAMIETRPALDALDDILAIDGIDGIFVGPADFSIAWSGGETVNAVLDDMNETIADIAARARAASKLAGIFAPDPKRIGMYAGMGFGFISAALDTTIINSGVDAILAGSGTLTTY